MWIERYMVFSKICIIVIICYSGGSYLNCVEL